MSPIICLHQEWKQDTLKNKNNENYIGHVDPPQSYRRLLTSIVVLEASHLELPMSLSDEPCMFLKWASHFFPSRLGCHLTPISSSPSKVISLFTMWSHGFHGKLIEIYGVGSSSWRGSNLGSFNFMTLMLMGKYPSQQPGKWAKMEYYSLS